MPNHRRPMYRQIFVYLLLLFVGSAATASGVLPGIRSLPGTAPKFLPVDEAFHVSSAVVDGTVTLRWRIAPGYYLYRNKLGFADANGPLNVVLPSGTLREDEYFGKVQVFLNELTVDIVLRDSRQIDVISVTYQGCAEAGLCYPPQKREITR